MPQKKPREGRRHCIPPAPHPRSQFDLFANLEGALGAALWRALRDVLLWSETRPESRAGLFPPATAAVAERYADAVREAPRLASAFETFAVLRHASESVSPAEVGLACHRVYAWADSGTWLRVALHFAEAAAYADPDSPAYAVDAGRICRHASVDDFPARSAVWYQRAFVLALRVRNERESIRALTGFGALMQNLGNDSAARMAYLRAARRAKRTGRRRQAASAYHYLFSLAAETADLETAIPYARKALALYPVHDVRLPALAHDWAFLLIVAGMYRTALALLERVVRVIERPDELVHALGTAARAAGAAGYAARFAAAETTALEMVKHFPEYRPPIVFCLGEGARGCGRWEDAARYAAEALTLARQVGNVDLERHAEALVQAVALREPSAPAVEPVGEVAALTRRIAARLRRWRRRTRRNLDQG
jgi:tetratricopeptide (TPR) repeat protein